MLALHRAALRMPYAVAYSTLKVLPSRRFWVASQRWRRPGLPGLGWDARAGVHYGAASLGSVIICGPAPDCCSNDRCVCSVPVIVVARRRRRLR